MFLIVFSFCNKEHLKKPAFDSSEPKMSQSATGLCVEQHSPPLWVESRAFPTPQPDHLCLISLISSQHKRTSAAIELLPDYLPSQCGKQAPQCPSSLQIFSSPPCVLMCLLSVFLVLMCQLQEWIPIVQSHTTSITVGLRLSGIKLEIHLMLMVVHSLTQSLSLSFDYKLIPGRNKPVDTKPLLSGCLPGKKKHTASFTSVNIFCEPFRNNSPGLTFSSSLPDCFFSFPFLCTLAVA